MFNIKRFDLEGDNNTPSDKKPNNDRLSKLNARLNKHGSSSTNHDNNNNTGPVTDTSFAAPTTTTTRSFDEHRNSTTHQDRSTKRPKLYQDHNKHEKFDSKKKNATLRDSTTTTNTRGKKWEKKSKELKDSDLIPNDVRLAMKAEAEAAALLKKNPHLAIHLVPTLSAPLSTPKTTPAIVETILKKDEDQEMKEVTEQDDEEDDEDDSTVPDFNTTSGAQSDDDLDHNNQDDSERKQLEDQDEATALANLELVPLPSFEVKGVSALELKIAKSMGVPDWLAHPTVIEPETNTPIESTMFGFSSRLIKQCHKVGITECFAVQTAVIPVLMRARHLGDIRRAPGDLCVSAPTGSGKTLAYTLPIIEILSQRVVTRLRALIVLPTRDLCVQVKETFDTFVKGTDLKVATSTGQSSFAHEQSVLVGNDSSSHNGSIQHGQDSGNNLELLGGISKVDVLITTPGRLIDHIKSTPNFTLQHLRFLVIDEADRLLNQSFQDWLFHILNAIHPSEGVLAPTSTGSTSTTTTTATTVKSQQTSKESGSVAATKPCAQIKLDRYGLPIHDAIAPGFLSSFFDTPESDLEDAKVLSVQKLLFSATLTRNPAKIASLQLSDAQYVAVRELGSGGGGGKGEEEDLLDDSKQKYTTPAGLTEHMIVCETAEKPLMVLHLLHHLQVRKALCFTKSVESAHRLFKLIQLYEKRLGKEATMVDGNEPSKSSTKMEVDESEDSESDDDSGSSDDDDDDDDKEDDDDENTEKSTNSLESSTTTATKGGIVVAEYSSDLSRNRRTKILKLFNSGEIDLLICSDLISRGMDLSPVSVVINYDAPIYMKKYIHRVGRTARAGKLGTAYSLVETQEARHFKEMMTKAGHLEKVKRIKVKTETDCQDLVQGYEAALADLRDAVSNTGVHEGGGSGQRGYRGGRGGAHRR